MSLLVETYKKSTKLFLHPGKVSLDERPPGASSPEATRWVVEPRPASGSITFSAAQTDAGPRCFQLRHGRRSSAAKAFPWTWTTSFRASKERGLWLVKNHRHFASSLAIHGKKSISVSLGGLRLCAPGCYGCSRSPLSISQYFLTWILLLLNETICVQHALHSVNSLCWWIW